MAEVVKRMGFVPVFAHKPADALNVVRLQTVHAAIVDVLLPKMSGIDLAVEFKQTKFADNPVILVSGIFKDRAFAAEGMKKTGASAFIFKPFSVDEITGALGKALEGQLATTKWTVQSLLTRKFKSGKDRAKAVENLEEIRGFDFPFVLSTLLDPEASGHLNIVNPDGDSFGILLNQGTVCKVETEESRAAAVSLLIESGFLTQEDWDAFAQTSDPQTALDKLTVSGLVSPHAVNQVRGSQLLKDFLKICGSADLKIAFTLTENDQPLASHALDRTRLLKLMSTSMEEIFQLRDLRDFYAPVKSAPIQLLATADELEGVWSLLNLKDMEHFQAVVESSEAIDTLVGSGDEQDLKIYRSLHFLVLSHMIMFTDTARAKNINNMLNRYKKLHADLSKMTPDKIFEFFGANAQSSPDVINNIYEEYVLSNHPGQIPKEASAELKELCRKCFDIVTEAKEIMIDDEKRQKLFAENRARAGERQAESMKLVNVAMDLLRKGQAQQALAKSKEAEALHSSSRGVLIGYWAEIKAGNTGGKPRLIEIANKMDSLPPDDKRTALYYMVLGLVKKAMGDVTAPSYFEKALQLDGQFVEARRELNSTLSQAASNSAKKKDIFNADITQIVSQIFRRKAD